MPNQTLSDRILLSTVLGSPAICRFLHTNANVNINYNEVKKGRHIFISGMARAGTTSLLDSLNKTGDFYSLTYKQLPFIFAPKVNKWFDRVRSSANNSIDRAHQDGIKVNVDSPEALDGIFWRTFDPIRSDFLTPKLIPENIMLEYIKFIGYHLLEAGKKRYLSKMNQNLFRIQSLLDVFTNSKVLVLYRNPIEQAASLFAQHLNFIKLNKFDAFFINTLEHYEFGMLHKPFRLKATEANFTDVEFNLNYWLLQWIENYTFVVELCEKSRNIIPLPFNDLHEENKLWDTISTLIDTKLSANKFQPKARRFQNNINKVIDQKHALKVYEQLNLISRQRLKI